ncbi:phosphoribosylglycinamide formyltransferase [Salinispira pacifica]
MADFAVLASGKGTNFEALADAFVGQSTHSLTALLSDRRSAPVLLRAQERGIPAYYLPYSKSDRTLFERAAITVLRGLGVDLVVLAGFMRILTPLFVSAFAGRIINIHPSLLPDFPGEHAIERSFASGNRELGVTIHFVDEGLDSGDIIIRESFERGDSDTLPQVESRIHAIEHRLYPETVRSLLDGIETARELEARNFASADRKKEEV